MSKLWMRVWLKVWILLEEISILLNVLYSIYLIMLGGFNGLLNMVKK